MKTIVLSILTLIGTFAFGQEKNEAKRVETKAISQGETALNTEIKLLDRSSFLYQEFAEKVGILNDELLILDDLKVYPNPNEGLFNIEFTEANGTLIKIFVYDFTGKILFSDDLQSTNSLYSAEIDISKQPSGIYFLLIKQNDASQTRKIEKI